MAFNHLHGKRRGTVVQREMGEKPSTAMTNYAIFFDSSIENSILNRELSKRINYFNRQSNTSKISAYFNVGNLSVKMTDILTTLSIHLHLSFSGPPSLVILKLTLI